MGLTLRIPTAEVFQPLLAPSDYKGAYGGRGSGKSHFFGEGLRMVCIREAQKELSQSSKLLIEDKIAKCRLGSADGFHIWKDRIETPKDGLIIFKGMNDYTAESAKSLERFKRAWIDEAQTLSARELALLGPTIHRWSGSEIWASWNPTRKNDAIDEFFRGAPNKPGEIVLVMANCRDNPFWNDSAERQRRLELERYPERYPHTYEGECAGAFEGAYFARLLTEAKLKGRIGAINADPLLPLLAYVDIGGSGVNANGFVIWIVQFVDGDILVLDHYESRGQSLAYHVKWLRDRGYQDAEIVLPHDGVNENNVTGKRYEDHLFQGSGDPKPKQGGRGAEHRGRAPARAEIQIQRGDHGSRPASARLLSREARRSAQYRPRAGARQVKP
jgi:phage terminase large subunit